MTRPTQHPAPNSTARKRLTLVPTPCCDAAAAVARVRALAEVVDGLAGMTFNGEPFPPAVTLADLRAALDGPAGGGAG